MSKDLRSAHYEAVYIGRRNKAAGDYWESLIAASCENYSITGEAEIEKTPEPVKVVQSLGNGKFVSVFSKKAQPDYKGTLKGGRAIVFEAKHTNADKLLRTVISSEQEKRLDKHTKLGAACYVMVSFKFESFYMIPWTVFGHMKAYFGRQYITKDDVARYRLRFDGKMIYFLDGII